MKYIIALACVALILSGYITWSTLSEKQLAGCGEGSGCDEVVKTRWGKWMGIPVSIGGAATYAVLLFAAIALRKKSSRTGWRLLLLLSVLAAGSALWFILVQVLIIKDICKFCMAVHGCGILICILSIRNVPLMEKATKKEAKTRTDLVPRREALLAGAAGMLGVAVLIGGQLISAAQSYAAPAPETPSGQAPSASTAPPAAPVARGKEIVLGAGQLKITMGDYPVIGSTGASRILAVFLDYTCPACRQLHPVVTESVRKMQGKVAVIVLPMPLDGSCNPGIQGTSYQHQNACRYWQMALAVWKTNPNAFQQFDDFLFQAEYPPSPEQARAVANQLIGADQMEWAMANPRLGELVRAGIRMFASPVIQKKALPTLISERESFTGIAPSQEFLYSLEAPQSKP